VEADWRYALILMLIRAKFEQYFGTGGMNGQPLQDWIRTGEAVRPDAVIDQRDWAATKPEG
jgi:hypothetical protein